MGAYLRVLQTQGLLTVERPAVYHMHRLLHEYAWELVKTEDAGRLSEWAERFAKYYRDLGGAILQQWGTGDELIALARWTEELRNFVAGYKYALELELEQWAADYWTNLYFYLGVTGQRGIVVQWHQWWNAMVKTVMLRVMMAGHIGAAYFLLGVAYDALACHHAHG